MTARRVFLALMLAAISAVAAPVAAAIPNTCPTIGPDAATVNINEPLPGSSFAGQVTVRGRASATAGLTRVELFVGEALKDYQLFTPAKTDLEYLLRFDVAGVQSDIAAISVVACGGGPGAAVRGIASINVRVDRAAVVTTPPIALTPVERSDVAAGSKTGPLWVGAAFGLAGLVGVVAATGVRRAREASEPFPAGGPAGPGAAAPRRPAPDPAVSPARPSRARRAGASGARPGVADGPFGAGVAPAVERSAGSNGDAAQRRRRAPGVAKPGSDGRQAQGETQEPGAGGPRTRRRGGGSRP